MGITKVTVLEHVRALVAEGHLVEISPDFKQRRYVVAVPVADQLREFSERISGKLSPTEREEMTRIVNRVALFAAGKRQNTARDSRAMRDSKRGQGR